MSGSAAQRVARNSGAVGIALAVCLVALGGCAASSSGASTPTSMVRTPAGTPTREQALTTIAQAAAGSVPVTVTLSATPQTALVTATATLSGAVARTPEEIAASQERVKAVTFALQRALWTGGGASPSAVKVNVLGPLFDDYFDSVTDWYGGAQVTAKTQATLAWATLSADTAWNIYDVVWLRPYYTPFQQWGAQNPTQP